MQFAIKPRLPALSCSLAFLLCELISRPWAEMGLCDDWSYIYSSLLLAKTGHVHYVGFAAAIVGWQFYLGAAFIKLLGFSFTAPRLGTLLIATVTAYLMQRTLIRFGIGEGNAVLGTLTFVLSPLFMQLSASMMTDVPGFFSVLACIYGCVRALQTLRNRDAILWLSFAVAVNTICGTSRQICWLGVLVLVPSTLWLLRSRRTVFLFGLAVTAVGFVCVFATLHWFNVQPYALPEPLSLPPFHIWAWKFVGRQYVKSLLEIGLLIFPLALPFIAAVRRFSARNLIGLFALAAFSAAFIYYLGQKAALLSLLNPFQGDWFGSHAVFEFTLLASPPPTVLGPAALASLSGIAVIGILCIAGSILIARPSAIQPTVPGTLSWYQIAVLFGPFTAVTLLLLSRRGIYLITDRYLISLIFVALVCVLLYSQQRLRVRWQVGSYVALSAVALFGIICTHNTFALQRARVVLANEIFATGVPASHVDFGWEMNGWYELQLSPYINNPIIVRPAGAYHAYTAPPRSGCHEETLFGSLPHLAPRYGIAFRPDLCDGPAPFAPVSYSTWPLRKPTMLYVVKYPPPWESAIETENQLHPVGKK